MSMELDIDLVWLAECWRCANTGETAGSREQALDTFRLLGWAKVGDGFQVCPQCSGRGPA